MIAFNIQARSAEYQPPLNVVPVSCVALDCIIKDIAKQVTAAKQVLTVAGDLRPDRARKRDPMVSPFRYGD